jgi:hypothetical protein
MTEEKQVTFWQKTIGQFLVDFVQEAEHRFG